MESALAFLAGMVFMAVLFIGGAFLVSRFVPDDEPEWVREAQQGLIEPGVREPWSKDGE